MSDLIAVVLGMMVMWLIGAMTGVLVAYHYWREEPTEQDSEQK